GLPEPPAQQTDGLPLREVARPAFQGARSLARGPVDDRDTEHQEEEAFGEEQTDASKKYRHGSLPFVLWAPCFAQSQPCVRAKRTQTFRRHFLRSFLAQVFEPARTIIAASGVPSSLNRSQPRCRFQPTLLVGVPRQQKHTHPYGAFDKGHFPIRAFLTPL